MAASFTRINSPEIVIGFVAPIGVDLRTCLTRFSQYFENAGYTVVPLKVTDVFAVIAKHIPPATKLVQAPRYERFQSYIDYGNQIRKYFENDELLAATR